MKMRSETGIIYSLNFNGVSGPRSGEVVVCLHPVNKLLLSDGIALHLGWPTDDSAASKTEFVSKIHALMEAYIRQTTVEISFKPVPDSLPEILTVS